MLLLVALEAALPLMVSPTAELLAALRRQRPDWVLGDTCIVDSVRYTGDDGGIVVYVQPDGCEQFNSICDLHPQ